MLSTTNGLSHSVNQALHNLERVVTGIEGMDARIAKLDESIKILGKVDLFRDEEAAGSADGTGALTLTILNQTGYVQELVSFAATSAAGGGMQFYLHAVSPQNLIWVQATSTAVAESFPSGFTVPKNAQLVVAFQGVGAATLCTIRLHMKRTAATTREPSPAFAQG